MQIRFLATVALLALSSPAMAGSTLSIGGGFNAGSVHTGTTAVTHGTAAAGSLASGNNASLGAGFAATSPAGALTSGIGASAGQSNSISGAASIGNGSAMTSGRASNFGVGVGGGFTNRLP